MILAENNEREEASPFYTAMIYQKLMDMERLENPGQLAEKIGKDRTSVGKYLSLTKVPDQVKQSGNRFPLGLRHWLEITKLPEEMQVPMAEECAEKDYSVRELQKRVKAVLNPKQVAAEAPVATEPPPAFQFTWKGQGLHIKGRLFTPHKEHIMDYANELQEAYERFMEEEKNHMTKAA
jgi:ParB-like chromosome segregation protein Spo0J